MTVEVAQSGHLPNENNRVNNLKHVVNKVLSKSGLSIKCRPKAESHIFVVFLPARPKRLLGKNSAFNVGE